jgi:hypothetical protein
MLWLDLISETVGMGTLDNVFIFGTRTGKFICEEWLSGKAYF